MSNTPIMTFRLYRQDRKLLSEHAHRLHISQAEVIRLLIRGKIYDPLKQILSHEEFQALAVLATREERSPQQQAVILIRTMLQIEGLVDDHEK